MSQKYELDDMGKKRLLLITLTDGCRELKAIEYTPLSFNHVQSGAKVNFNSVIIHRRKG